MLKNGIISAAALVALLGSGACGDAGEAEPEPQVVEQVSAPAEEVSPEVYEGTVVMDTSMAGMVVDTSGGSR